MNGRVSSGSSAPMPASNFDADLSGLRGGHPRAWEALLTHVERRCLALATRLLNDPELGSDAVQEGFLRAFSAREQLRPDSNVESWLIACVANTARDLARKRAAANSADQAGADNFRWSVPAARPDADEREERLRAALARLEEMPRLIFLLVFQEGHSYEEVARQLGIPIGTVRSKLSRARERLREMLGDPAPVEPLEKDKR
jgi:RNA polymerase sigma-70 factor (ECF subfamily)